MGIQDSERSTNLSLLGSRRAFARSRLSASNTLSPPHSTSCKHSIQRITKNWVFLKQIDKMHNLQAFCFHNWIYNDLLRVIEIIKFLKSVRSFDANLHFHFKSMELANQSPFQTKLANFPFLLQIKLANPISTLNQDSKLFKSSFTNQNPHFKPSLQNPDQFKKKKKKINRTWSKSLRTRSKSSLRNLLFTLLGMLRPKKTEEEETLGKL